MTSRERRLTALSNGRPDRLPCQVHGWMTYYNITVTGGKQFPASSFSGLDAGHAVSDVVIDNLVINGQRIITAADGRLQIGAQVHDVRFTAP